MPSPTGLSRTSSSALPDLAPDNTAPRAEPPPSAPPSAPTRPALSRRNDGGIGLALRHKFAPRPMTTSSSLFGSVTKARPSTARAKVAIAPGEAHQPDLYATTQSAALRHGRNVARTVGGGEIGSFAKEHPMSAKVAIAPEDTYRPDPNAPLGSASLRLDADVILTADDAAERACDPPLGEAGGTEAVAARLFNRSGMTGGHKVPAQIASDLRHYLAPPEGASADVVAEAGGRQELVLRRMAQAFGSDAAAADSALDDLVAADSLHALEHGAFELARRLATTALGHSTLIALCGQERVRPNDSALGAAVRKDAQRLAFTAANALIDALPEGAPRPASMADVRRIAIAALPAHERPHGTRSQSPPAQMKGNVTLPAKALLAALQLAANPEAEPERHLKSAYFSWRCGFTAEGPGTPLARAQQRMFKLSRYAQRASDPGTLAGLRRAFGFNKSPMSALAMGTGGASLRQPEDDLLKANVIRDFGAVLVQRAQARDGGSPAQRISDALKGATLERWHERTGQKGWRDKTTVTATMRKAIATRAAELTGVSVAAIKLSPTYEELKGTRSLRRPRGGAELDVATLRAWIGQCELSDSGAGEHGAIDAAALRAGADQLATLEHYGEVPLDTSTPQTVLENFKRVITEPRMTYDVRLTNGGQFGINFSAAELINSTGIEHLPFVPFALAGPDVKLMHGRMAMINGGSSANHGQLFIGSDRRISAHLGASATGGVTLLGKKMVASATVQALPFMLDTASPKGVMVRCRMQPIGPAPDSHPDPWRAKLLSVVDAATASGANGGLPGDVHTMWEAMSHTFYKDPDVSVNWLDSRSASVSSSVGLSAGSRVQHDGYKLGPNVQANATKNWLTRLRRQETPGPLRAEYASSSSARQVGASASLVAAPPSQGNFSGANGHVKSVALPSASIIGFGTTVLQSETGSVWRIAEEDGHIDPSLSYRDTTFTSVKEMKRYVDSRRDSWDAVYPNQAAGASTQAEPIDEYLARVEEDATVGNQVYAERVWLRPDAARKINVLRELRDALVAPNAQPDRDQAAQIARHNEQISTLLESDGSWDKRFLYSLEIAGQARTAGPNFMATAQQVSEVAHPHQLSVLRAERPASPTGSSGR